MSVRRVSRISRKRLCLRLYVLLRGSSRREWPHLRAALRRRSRSVHTKMEDIFCQRAFSLAHEFRPSKGSMRASSKAQGTVPRSFMDILAGGPGGSASCFVQQGDSFMPLSPDGWWEVPAIYAMPPSLRGLSLGGLRPSSEGVLPCGLRATEAMDLMHRELGPEDYEMLSKLDEAVPKKDVAQASIVDSLPRIRGRRELAADCGICLAKLGGGSGENKGAVRLPCEHTFHLECISKWLTECKNACPICSTPIDRQAKEPESGGLAGKEANKAPEGLPETGSSKAGKRPRTSYGGSGAAASVES